MVDASVYKQSSFKLEGHGDMMNHHRIHLSLIPPTCKLIPCTMDDSRVYSPDWTEEIHMLMKDKPGSASFFAGFLNAKWPLGATFVNHYVGAHLDREESTVVIVALRVGLLRSD